MSLALGLAVIPLGADPTHSERPGAEALTGVADLNGRPTNPFAKPLPRATVLVFVSTECPISNRYAPELRRLQSAFAARGVVFELVYPNADESATAIREHLKEYQFGLPAVRDARHQLVRLAKARVTPEAAVFGPAGELLYHGRIDDRYIELGRERPEASRHDLADTIEAILAGKSAPANFQPAVGCSITEAR